MKNSLIIIFFCILALAHALLAISYIGKPEYFDNMILGVLFFILVKITEMENKEKTK